MEKHLKVPFIGTIGTFTAVLLALNWHFLSPPMQGGGMQSAPVDAKGKVPRWHFIGTENGIQKRETMRHKIASTLRLGGSETVTNDQLV